MSKILQMLAIVALLTTGCGCLNAPNQPSGLPLRYHHAQYDLTFFLPASWRGFSVLSQQWDGETYSPATDEMIVVGHGTIITLRHPQWTASAPYQDIPILVFTRAQWDALLHGKLWPSLFAGGTMHELWHSQEYVFGISSRYTFDDSVREWKETADIVEWNRAANSMPHLYPE
jgi:hypothetical protein